jgi:hypothetical protein
MPPATPRRKRLAEKAELEKWLEAEAAKPRQERDRFKVYQKRQRLWKINRALAALAVKD